tara:strand:- start:2899 stop:3969 length:1071 start_codon:yes stop_codon:yes gene_type:complete
MSGNEKGAMQNQELMQSIRGAEDKVAAYTAASEKAYAAKNPKLGYFLQSKATELSAAQAEERRKEKKMQLDIAANNRAERTIGPTLEGVGINNMRDFKKLQNENAGFQTLSPQELLKEGFDKGSIVQRTGDNKLVVIDAKGEQAENVGWAFGLDSKSYYKIGQKDGKMVKIEGEGTSPLNEQIRPVEQRTRVIDPNNAYGQMKEEFKTVMLPMEKQLEEIEKIKGLAGELRTNEKALAQFGRLYVKLTGPDASISQTELDRVLGGGDLAQRSADFVSKFVNGTITGKSVKSFQDLIAVVEEITAIQMRNRAQKYLALNNGYPDPEIPAAANRVVAAYQQGSGAMFYKRKQQNGAAK